MLAETIKEYNVVLIRSAMNKADALAQVWQQWLTSVWKGSNPLQQLCSIIAYSLDSE